MKNKQGIIILIITCVMVLAWIGFNIWHNSQVSTITEPQNVQIKPIIGTFDTKTINALKKRIYITPAYLVQPVIQQIATPSATPPPVISLPVSSPSGQATSSGGIIP